MQLTWGRLAVVAFVAYAAWTGVQHVRRSPPEKCSDLGALQSHGAFESAQVAFRSDGLKIGALLTKPKGPGPFPAYIHNHGAMTRTQARDPLWSVPEPIDARLASAGYVVLRPARRGYLGSQGSSTTYWTQDSLMHASDVIAGAYEEARDVDAAIAYLQGCPFVSGRRIAIGGYSVGGIVVTATAARHSDLAGIVSINGGITWIQNGVQEGYPAVRSVWRKEAGNLSAPVLLLYGRNDKVVPWQLGADFAEQLKQRSAPVTFIVHEGDHYAFPVEEIVRFLDANVKAR